MNSSQGHPWARAHCRTARCPPPAASGHLAILQWARAEGCPWDELTCQGAAAKGHLEVLQWARAKGCPWDESTCEGASKNRQVRVLIWARANGCPWDVKKCVEGIQAVLQYALTNPTECTWDEIIGFVEAGENY